MVLSRSGRQACHGTGDTDTRSGRSLTVSGVNVVIKWGACVDPHFNPFAKKIPFLLYTERMFLYNKDIYRIKLILITLKYSSLPFMCYTIPIHKMWG